MPAKTDDREKFLRHKYGKRQYHTISSYLDQSNDDAYQNLNFMEDIISTQPHFYSAPFVERGALSQSNRILIKKTCVHRPCDLKCVIPSNWATRIYTALKTLRSNLSINNLQKNIIEFENCGICRGHYLDCPDYEKCTDNLFYIAKISIHFPAIRKLLRNLYNLRKLNSKLLTYNHILFTGQFDELSDESLIITDNIENNSLDDERMDLDMEQTNLYDTKYIDKIKEDFNNELQKRLNLQECLCCHKLLPTTYLTHLPKKISCKNNLILNQLFGNEFDKDNILICRNYCYKDIFTMNRTPVYSCLNNMFLGAIPDALKGLNIYERLSNAEPKYLRVIEGNDDRTTNLLVRSSLPSITKCVLIIH